MPSSEASRNGSRGNGSRRSRTTSSVVGDVVDPSISVVGVGGGGGTLVSALDDREIKGVETVAVNTDPAGLSKAECDVKILLPHSEDEDRVVAARVSAEDQEGALRASLSSDIVFIVAGLGGAAGTGAAESGDDEDDDRGQRGPEGPFLVLDRKNTRL